MKKFYYALMIAVFTAVTAWNNDAFAQYPGEKMYSNSYDGYTNVRNAHSSKGEILGKLHNGNSYVVVIGMVDNWIKVKYNGSVGYVHKNYVSDTPSAPVTSGVDAKWIEGAWCGDGGYSFLLLFSNGKYCYHSQYNEICYGKWKLEYDTIFLTRTAILDYDIPSESRLRLEIDKSAKTIDGMTKWRLPESLEEGEDGFTRSYFQLLKKGAGKYVK